MADQQQWDGTTYGTEGMLHTLVRMLRHMDVRVLYAFTNIFVIPVTMVTRPGARVIYHYFRRRHHCSRLSAIWHTYRNHCLFGQIIIDKFAMFARKQFDVQVVDNDCFKRLATQPDGFVMLSSHVGNYEMAGYSLQSDDKRLNAIVYDGEKATVMEGRKHLFAHTNIRMISVRPDMSHLFAINDALADGEIVSIPGDRVFGSKKTVEVMLLGAKAQLPMGPFAVAASRGVEVLAVNVMKSRAKQYTAYVTPLPYDRSLRQREQIQQLATAYAKELERLLLRYPEQWYNYFEFWP